MREQEMPALNARRSRHEGGTICVWEREMRRRRPLVKTAEYGMACSPALNGRSTISAQFLCQLLMPSRAEYLATGSLEHSRRCRTGRRQRWCVGMGAASGCMLMSGKLT